MELVLKIENEPNLPDGGPLSITIQGTRGIDIGRDQYLDWTLPDPSRFISGKHCEVRWHDGAYWLHDVSTNGTFLDGAEGRLKAPHKLRNGDRFLIGHYVILATITGITGEAPETGAGVSSAPSVSADYDSLWNPTEPAAPPLDPKQLKAPRDLQPVKPDFLDWAIDVPSAQPPMTSAPLPRPQDITAPVSDEDLWMQGAPKALPSNPKVEATPLPKPRRPTPMTAEPSAPWTESPAEASEPPNLPQTAAIPPQGRRPSEVIAEIPPKGTAEDILRRIARSAGIPEDVIDARDPGALADELGQFIRLVTDNLKQLLDARQQTKRLTRSTSQTTVQALDNNPLKFAPTIDEALRTMFGPPTRSYLDARGAVSQGFNDLKTHQVKTLSAMQRAISRLLEEFDPAGIEKEGESKRSFSDIVGSRNAKLWDIYRARWQARTGGDLDGALNAFMRYFAEYYDLDGNGV